MNHQFAHQQDLFQQFAQAGAAGGAYGGGFGGAAGAGGNPNGFYAPNFAGSSAAFGPNGHVHQTATLIPANPVIELNISLLY